jgi:hypothetical protein
MKELRKGLKDGNNSKQNSKNSSSSVKSDSSVKFTTDETGE